jgi:hypothetical protein
MSQMIRMDTTVPIANTCFFTAHLNEQKMRSMSLLFILDLCSVSTAVSSHDPVSTKIRTKSADCLAPMIQSNDLVKDEASLHALGDGPLDCYRRSLRAA